MGIINFIHLAFLIFAVACGAWVLWLAVHRPRQPRHDASPYQQQMDSVFEEYIRSLREGHFKKPR